MAIGAAIGGSALLGAVSSNKAAKAQKSAANNQLALQREMYDQTRYDLSPYREGGQDAVTAQNYLLGLSAAASIIRMSAMYRSYSSPVMPLRSRAW